MKSFLKMLIFFFCLIVPVIFFLPVSGKAETPANYDLQIQTKDHIIKKLSSERINTQSLIEQLKKREWGVLEILKVINDSLKKNREKLEKLIKATDLLQLELLTTTGNIRKLRHHIEQDKAKIAQQLYALFHISTVRKMTPFVGLGSFEHYSRNQRLLQRNTKLNAQTVVRFDKNLKRFKKEYERQNEQNVQLTSLRKAKEEQKNLLEFEQQQQFTYLQHIRKDRSTRLKYLREIQVELERLNDMIHLLEKKKENEKISKKFSGLRKYKNALPAPVKGKLIHRFGRKHSPFYTLFKRGVLVETKKNDTVRSILPGKVVWSGPFWGYQNLVILDHGRGSLSVYGNLDEVFVIAEDVIDQNYVLGTVAYSTTENRYLFYFETRYNKRAVNPVQWLKKPVW